MRLMCALGLLLALLHLSTALLLGAFNIRRFGGTKASKPHVMDIIKMIVHRYDVILIQELLDSDLSVTEKLMDLVNSSSIKYNYIVSEPLGLSTYKERYLFLYRVGMVSVADSYQYTDYSVFSRPPFVVMFSSPKTAVKEFALIPQHTSPPDAVQQINALYDVAANVSTKFKTNNIVLLGDFNAGCDYVKTSDWKNIRLFTNKSFHWLIPDSAVTNISPTRGCPYDRIVVTNEMMKGVKPSSADVYNFTATLALSQSLVLEVSDHFPVEVELKELGRLKRPRGE